MKTNIIKLVGVQALLVFAALLFGGASANAAADTCVWTGGGTGTVDSGANTITFNVNDASNWSTCDNGAIPEAGDTLEFPANLADVDPGDTIDDNDEWQWAYIVNNDLPADIDIAGINFTGTPTSYEKSVYYIVGNAISLSGDVLNQYTAYAYAMSGSNYGGIFVDGITVTADVAIEARVGGYYSSNNSYQRVNMNYGANSLTVSANIDADDFLGTGDVTYESTNSAEISVGSHGSSDPKSDFYVAEDSTGRISISSLTIEKMNSLTVLDGGLVYIRGSVYDAEDSHELELPLDMTFVGTGKDRAGGGGQFGDLGGSFQAVSEERESYETDPRMDINLNGASMGEYPKSYNKSVSLELSGTISFEDSDLTLATNSNVDFSGSLSGSGNEIDPRDSLGIVTVSSSENDSDSEGTLNSRKIYKTTYSGTFDQTYPVFANSGYEVVLDDIELQDVTVQPFGRLSGNGGTANLYVAPDGTVAPGESPGCIETDGDLTLNGTYEFEIEDDTACSGYDQLDVTGAVDITGATLEISLLDDYNFDVDTEFILINNDGSDDVTGEFDGLEEGDTITVDGNDFEISYEGGDGNDVSVLAISISDENAASEEAPGAPDTGVGSLMQNPMVTLLAAVLAAGAIVGLRKVQSSRN